MSLLASALVHPTQECLRLSLLVLVKEAEPRDPAGGRFIPPRGRQLPSFCICFWKYLCISSKNNAKVQICLEKKQQQQHNTQTIACKKTSKISRQDEPWLATCWDFHVQASVIFSSCVETTDEDSSLHSFLTWGSQVCAFILLILLYLVGLGHQARL